MNKNYSYSSVLIVGMGLIGSSIARSLKENKIAEKVYALDNNCLLYTSPSPRD